MARLILVLIVMLVGCRAAMADIVKLRDFDVAGWEKGGVYVNSATGEFRYCASGGRYKSNIDLHIAVYRDYGWSLSFVGMGWKIPKGPVPLVYRFDNGPWSSIVGTYKNSDFFLLEMPGGSVLISLFRRSRQMDIKFSQGQFSFTLDGSSRLISALADCVDENLAAENPPGLAKPRVSKSPPKAVPSDSSGTGFIVSSVGHILTNNHVVEGCSAISISRTGDITRQAAVLRTDSTNDLAVLKMDASVAPDEIAKFRTRSVRAGESIAAYGFPLAGTLSASGNIVSGNVSSLAGLADDVRLFQISAPIQPGNSGGPLLDMTGAVVGIVNGKLNELATAKEIGSLPQNVNFSIKSNVGLNFLDAHSIPYETSGEDPALDLPTIADRAKKFTVFVACRHD